jgi:hypothetical protein
MKTLKEKFGQFEMTKEQMKMVKGGTERDCYECYEIVYDYCNGLPPSSQNSCYSVGNGHCEAVYCRINMA